MLPERLIGQPQPSNARTGQHPAPHETDSDPGHK
jgi:hypothetical protein